MSWITDNPPTEVVFAGPDTTQAAGAATAGWAQVAVSSTTAQNLVVGATGASGGSDTVQPVIPAGFFKPGRSNQVVTIEAAGIISTVATAGTTASFTFGVSTAAQLAATGVPAATATTLITTGLYNNASIAWSSIPWYFRINLHAKRVGFGTTAIATSILASGFGGVTPLVTPAVGAVPNFGPIGPNVTTTIDASINNYIWAAVTFGTNASTSNTCTMLHMIVDGRN
jgi:hypothetical protein